MILEAFGCKALSLQECSEFMSRLLTTLRADEVGRLQYGNKHMGIVILVGGISLRTWPRSKFITLDIFSCKEFYPELIQALVLHWFAPRDIKTLRPTWESEPKAQPDYANGAGSDAEIIDETEA